MNRGDKLNGPGLEGQCSAAISKLQADTQALNALKTAVNNFNSGDELKGTSIQGMKQQLNDYLTVIEASIMANDVDIEDFQTLSSTAGGEVIDGTAIMDEWDSAKAGKAGKASAERSASNARRWAAACIRCKTMKQQEPWITVRGFMMDKQIFGRVLSHGVKNKPTNLTKSKVPLTVYLLRDLRCVV